MCANYVMYANVARFTVLESGHLFEFLEVDHQLPGRVNYTDVTLEEPTACSAMVCERFLHSLEKFFRNNRGTLSDDTLFEQSMDVIREFCNLIRAHSNRFIVVELTFDVAKQCLGRISLTLPRDVYVVMSEQDVVKIAPANYGLFGYDDEQMYAIMLSTSYERCLSREEMAAVCSRECQILKHTLAYLSETLTTCSHSTLALAAQEKRKLFVKFGRQTKDIFSLQLLPFEDEPDYSDDEEPEERVFLLSSNSSSSTDGTLYTHL